ncbi:formate dehydrogenase accessory sulfurtransferase FdhD [Methylobrevis albus]|uniref:Sulfur carrier protein FdhD n=1 Tax=Methylobrevis albus TaxID=2793297 RepID=A0A931MYQ8_9HYPH|nr:formate dehydrogenase accessory sulfurtransferase FdhD [Methylobrevis albus]MBH0238240.1 formate dehydrogenase accessory sulfurtransferase FdhD [Methylobrevis albus]
MVDPVARVRAVRVPLTGPAEALERAVPEEVPVALVHDGTTYAVMLATPSDLEDFAVGFSLTEKVIAAPDEIREFEVVEHDEGIELRMWLTPEAGGRVRERRRLTVGGTACGLCGVESLAVAVAPATRVAGELHVPPDAIHRLLTALGPAQELSRATRATHAAGFWTPADGLVAVREDVGRHNALDKLVGAVARSGIRGADGVVVVTSRVSVEMVQKTAALGATILVAVSAPTALALRAAEAAGLTLVAVARSDSFELFTHPGRILADADADAAGAPETLVHVA